MILTNLEIKLNQWGENEGKHTGKAKFSGDAGEVVLNLTPAHCEKIFLICADGILTTAKNAAENLTLAVIEHKSLIEAQP